MTSQTVLEVLKLADSYYISTTKGYGLALYQIINEPAIDRFY